MRVIFKRLKDVDPFESPGIVEEMADWFDGVTERNVIECNEEEHYVYKGYLVNEKWCKKLGKYDKVADEVARMFEL